ncbi:MAG: hypothetical protein HC915_02285 [Anaerolineae bacterium]|nr:hypothetical protein [Anaerolineae bacterium]
MFDINLPGIRVYDFDRQNNVMIENMQGTVGTFSPDGTRLLYPVLVRGAIGQSFYKHLEMVDFVSLQQTRVSGPPEAPLEDWMGAWHPDGERIAVARTYFDDRYTPGAQVYMLEVATEDVEPLVVDTDYHHSALAWSTDGQILVMERINRREPGSFPEVWAYDMVTEELILISTDAWLPGFLP